METDEQPPDVETQDVQQDAQSETAPVTPMQSTQQTSKKPSKTLPSPRLAAPKQLDATRAFVLASESEGGAVTNEQAGKIIGMAAGTIVVCNAFLCDVGLLIRRDAGRFDVSEIARAYAKAHEWNAETAGAKLAPAFEDKWFSKTLLPRLKMRDWQKAEAIQELAEAAGASKDYQANVEMLLDFLAVTGLIKYDGSTVRSGGITPPSDAIPKNGNGADPPAPKSDAETKGDTIWLNKERTRKATVIVPPDVNAKDVAHIAKWLTTNYFLDEAESSTPQD